MIQRSFFNIFSDHLSETRDFYIGLFGYAVAFESDWFIHLQAPENKALELGIIRRDHDIVHPEYRERAGGMLTIVVPDVDALVSLAKERGVRVIEEPRDLFYGQRRALLVDPNDTLLDVSSECPPDPEWLATL